LDAPIITILDTYGTTLFGRRSPVAPVIFAAVVFTATVAPGCSTARSSPDWDRRAVDASMLQDDGELDRAEESYRRLLETAVDAEDRRWVRLKLAQLAAARGQRDRALERYRTLWSDGPRDATGARALWEAAQLVDDPARRDEMEKRLVRTFPETSWSERAAESLVHRRCRRNTCDLEALGVLVESMEEAFLELPVGDNLVFRAAMAAQTHGGSLELARRWFGRIAEERPDSSMADDAERQLAEMAIDRQDWDTALDYLTRLSDRHERSRNFGILSSPHASWAQFKTGWIRMVYLDDYRGAIESFEVFLKRHPKHPRADDAAWHRTQALRLAGRRDAYRRALKALLDDYPESRYITEARTELKGIDNP
jgi:outer membrane protein assembly factor BamD (BamD/ComL family)